MKMRWPLAVVVLAAAALLVGAQPPAGSWMPGRARLFVADNNRSSPAVLVVDLPAFTVTQRIQLPGTTLQMGVSQENAHLGVFRNRDNDQQFFTVINTGIRRSQPAAGPRPQNPVPLKDGETGYMRPAFLAKSLVFVNGSDGIGGVEGGRQLVFHSKWARYIAYAESHGLILAYRSDHLHGATAFTPTARMNLPVGHFHVLPYGDHIVAPHTGVHKAFILDRTGRIVGEYNCTSCHGTAVYVPSESLKVAVFGCNTTVLVVRGTSATGVHVPAFAPRVGSFIDGVPGVFWSSNSAQSFFWRTDVRSNVPTVTNVTHRGGVLRLLPLTGSAAKGRFVALHVEGSLVLYDGDTGSSLANITLRQSGFANMTAPMLQCEADGSVVYVAVTSMGVVHRVAIHDEGDGHAHDHAEGEHDEEEDEHDEGPYLELEASLTVGGLPASMTLAYMPVATST